MPDVTRALLLPDWLKPQDGVLKSLALYWDEVIVPDSAYRWSPVFRVEELEKPPPWSDTTLELEDAGVVRRHGADIAAESLMPHGRPPNEDPDGELFLRIEKGEDGRARFTGTLRAQLPDTTEPSPEPDPDVAARNHREWREATASLHGDALIARAQQCREIAASNNLAPVAPSLLSHIASLTDEVNGPVMEGALIGVAVDAFFVRPDTPVEQLVAFRDKHRTALRRFRGAMTDLAAALRQPEIAPEAALSAARDIYRNRVEADLGALEERLSESRIKFLAKSLFGAAALATAPMATPAVAESAARFGAQTINYRFSREKLLQEHPYAYLHRLSSADFVIPRQVVGADLVSPDTSPRDFVYRHLDALFDLTLASENAQNEARTPRRFEAIPPNADVPD